MGGAASMGPEDWQRSCVEQIVGEICSKTNLRMNIKTAELKEVSRPANEYDEFEWTEDFDGQIILNPRLIMVWHPLDYYSHRVIRVFVMASASCHGNISVTVGIASDTEVRCLCPPCYEQGN